MKTTFHAPGTTDLACKLCGVAQRVEMEKDEDGGLYAELETEPCHADHCHKQLCRNCPQFECVCCGLTHCLSHRVMIGGREYCKIGADLFIRDAAMTPETDVDVIEARCAVALTPFVRAELALVIT